MISQQNATAPTLHLPNHRRIFSFKILSPQSAVCTRPPPLLRSTPLCQTCFWKKSHCSRKQCINSTWTLFYLSKYSAEKITVHSYQMCSSADRSSSAFVPPPPFFLNNRKTSWQQIEKNSNDISSKQFCIAHTLSSTSKGQ